MIVAKDTCMVDMRIKSSSIKYNVVSPAFLHSLRTKIGDVWCPEHGILVMPYNTSKMLL